MNEIRVVSPLACVSLALSAHALTDLLSIRKTLPYTLLMFSVTKKTLGCMFTFASIIHFGMDIGIFMSASLIMTLLFMSKKYEVVSCTLVCMYYTAIHVPLHLSKQDTFTNAVLVLISCCIFPFLRSSEGFIITETMQKMVIAHTVSAYM
jgi:hypothetical protein